MLVVFFPKEKTTKDDKKDALPDMPTRVAAATAALNAAKTAEIDGIAVLAKIIEAL